MKRILYTLTFLLVLYSLYGQTSYSGFIGKRPIDLVTSIFSDGDVRAIYTYSDIDEPIIINGRLQKGKLSLFEKDRDKQNRAMLFFDNFDARSEKLEGLWTNIKSKKELKITLTKMFDTDYGDSVEWPAREIIQRVSLKNKYFKLQVSKTKGDFYARVTGVKIYEKNTNKLIQKIDLDCQLMGLENIAIGDYNFDGATDFSVFEASYAGANTSSLYFLFDPETGKYFDSGFSGVSMEFDNKKKRIFERNQCCAGTIVTTAEYKVANNKMVLIEEHCFKWDEQKQDLVERKMEECR